MHRRIACVVVTVALAGATARAQEARVAAADRTAVEEAIRGSICWALTKDRPLAERVIAHDPDLFIFNPDSNATVCDIRELRVSFARSGSVAWWSAVLDDLAEWDGKPTGWKDTRWTGVLEKRSGAWVIVQMHFSFAADRVRAEVAAAAKK